MIINMKEIFFLDWNSIPNSSLALISNCCYFRIWTPIIPIYLGKTFKSQLYRSPLVNLLESCESLCNQSFISECRKPIGAFNFTHITNTNGWVYLVLGWYKWRNWRNVFLQVNFLNYKDLEMDFILLVHIQYCASYI